MSRIFTTVIVVAATAAMLGCRSEPRWWKGNLHTHSFWSDGDDYPEMVIDWYKDHGYHFVQLSEHNTLTDGERWLEVARRGGQAVFESYVARFGPDWVIERTDSAGLQARLRTFAEYRTLFDEPGQFLVLQGEEITDGFESKPIHLNATNVLELVTPQHGSSVPEVIQHNIDAVMEQRTRAGQAMLVHLNHPNFGWAVTAEDLVAVEGGGFFEVYNGHPAVRNEGDEVRPSTEHLWDIVLAERASHGMPLVFGIAVDDAHNYHDFDADHANPGRGWIVVRAAKLDPEALIAAMERGDFYGSTGVELEDLGIENGRFFLKIRADSTVAYATQFIGAFPGFAESEIGLVLAEVAGSEASYQFRGDELYVRAKVTSSRLKPNPYRPDEFEVAWTQPVTPAPGGGSERN
jgi:hypothetical protein